MIINGIRELTSYYRISYTEYFDTTTICWYWEMVNHCLYQNLEYNDVTGNLLQMITDVLLKRPWWIYLIIEAITWLYNP